LEEQREAARAASTDAAAITRGFLFVRAVKKVTCMACVTRVTASSELKLLYSKSRWGKQGCPIKTESTDRGLPAQSRSMGGGGGEDGGADGLSAQLKPPRRRTSAKLRGCARDPQAR
jgi:hypothetical protein